MKVLCFIGEQESVLNQKKGYRMAPFNLNVLSQFGLSLELFAKIFANACMLEFSLESHNWIKSCILIGLRSEVFSAELRVENEAR